MSKQMVLYVDKGEWVDGEVIEEEIPKGGNGFFNFFASFFHASHEPYNDDGREFIPETDSWEYVSEGMGGTKHEIIEGYGDSMVTDSGL